jgi:hypothetical protein
MTHRLNLHVLSALVFVYGNDIARASGWKDVASHRIILIHLFWAWPNRSYTFVLSPTTQLAPRSPAPTPPSPFDTPSPHYLPRPRIEASGRAGATQQAPPSMTSMRNNGKRLRRPCQRALRMLPATSMPSSSTHAPLSRWASTMDAPASRREGASCDAAPLVSCRRRCRIDVELCNDEYPPVQSARWHCVATPCCKCMFQVFQLIEMNVASCLPGCCKIHLDVAKIHLDVAILI